MTQKTRTPKYHADRTNQKLYFCRLACKEASKTVDKQIYQAHCETAIFHLHGAYLAFLQELNNFYNLNQTAPTVQSIEHSLAQRMQVSPEIQRLQQLLQTGFLAGVQHAFERCQYAPKPDAGVQKANLSQQGQDLIVNVVTLSNRWLPDEQTIREWRQQFIQLIDQLRAGMVEF